MMTDHEAEAVQDVMVIVKVDIDDESKVTRKVERQVALSPNSVVAMVAVEVLLLHLK